MSSSAIIGHHRPSLAIINHHQPHHSSSAIIIHHQPSSILGHQSSTHTIIISGLMQRSDLANIAHTTPKEASASKLPTSSSLVAYTRGRQARVQPPAPHFPLQPPCSPLSPRSPICPASLAHLTPSSNKVNPPTHQPTHECSAPHPPTHKPPRMPRPPASPPVSIGCSL